MRVATFSIRQANYELFRVVRTSRPGCEAVAVTSACYGPGGLLIGPSQSERLLPLSTLT